MENRTLKINALSGYTYGWLKMNDAKLADLPAVQSLSAAIELPQGVRAEKTDEKLLDGMRTGAGEELSAMLREAKLPVQRYTVPAGMTTGEDALRIYFDLPDSGEIYDPRGRKNDDGVPAAAGRFAEVEILLEDDADATVVMDMTSEEKAKGLAGVQTRIKAGERAKLRLVQILRPGKGYTLINDIGAECASEAQVEVIHLVLSGKNIYQGLSTELKGYKSSLTVDIGYIGRGDSFYDFNYEAVHTGKKTNCEIHAKGVLREKASKVFRDTIDFKHGCAGAVGNETEDVLLMDETVNNRSIPIILCAEEDVVGNHGATIGRLDEKLLFYMESRGMNPEEIYEMMAQARIDALLRQIPDVKTRCELLDGGQREEEDVL